MTELGTMPSRREFATAAALTGLAAAMYLARFGERRMNEWEESHESEEDEEPPERNGHEVLRYG